METGIDFLQWLDADMSLIILMYLDDPSDLIRASCVSRFWYKFVIANGLFKQLCLRKFPETCVIDHIVESNCKSEVPTCNEQLIHEREHHVYVSLFQARMKFPLGYCIASAVSASSTDNYPVESVANTLDPRDRVLLASSYWSSKGSSDAEVPESLIYQLHASVSVITEVNIHPFQDYYEEGQIYSSRSVRFRLGHLRSLSDIRHNFLELQQHADDKFVWTYTSQEFPMVQENRLQRFKLPEPTLCMGGFLKVEFLGRIQSHEMDNLFYICVTHVQAIGRSLSPAFEFKSEPPSLLFNGECFDQTVRNLADGSLSSDLPPVLPPDDFVWGHFDDFDNFMDMLNQQQAVDPIYQWWLDDNNERNQHML